MDSRHSRRAAGASLTLRSVLCAFFLTIIPGAARLATAAPVPSSDGLWTEIQEPPGAVRPTDPAVATTSAYKLYALNDARLVELLATAPMEFTDGAQTLVLSLPMPDGSYARFNVHRSPILSPQMAAKYPGNETYSVQGIDDPTASGRFDRTTLGFHATIISPAGSVTVEPEAGSDGLRYMVYESGDLVFPAGALQCKVEGRATAAPLGALGPPTGATLRTYRLAVGLTGELFDRYSDDIFAAAADVITTVNIVNAIFEVEVAVRFNVNFVVGWNDPATDPFSNPDATDSNALDEFEAALPTIVPVGDYDLGHLFHYGNFGGIARVASACGGPKERGMSSGTSPTGIAGVMRHEAGHQMGADHTFSSTNGSCTPGERECDSAIEPGEGNTIMSYAGSCAPDGVGGRIVFFHTHSYDQITGHIGGGGGCFVGSATGNTQPSVNAGSDYTIPRDTPFTLTASGNDPDGDAITYSWEQVDIAAGCALPPYNATGPLFRSRAPITGGVRTFPPMADVLSGAATLGEKLPTADRSLHFRCTVRDNRAGGGGVNYDGVTITVDGAPFEITSPNGGEELPAGCAITVTWNVGGGDVAANVSILYSSNGGSSWTTLAASTANDGSASVELPCGATTQGRIQVAAVGNIFFDVSDANFRVVNVAPVVSVGVVGGVVDASCQRTVTFSGGVTDDCAVDAGDVSVQVTLPGGGATLGAPVVNKVQTTAARVDVSGSVLVSALVGLPVTVQVEISGDDHCGNTGMNTNSDLVFDGTPPVIVCPADVVVECNDHCEGGGVPKDDAQLTAFFAGASATDNCDPSPDITNNAPDCFPLGDTQVTFAATDNGTNISYCQARVRVVDTTPPVITVALDRCALWPPNHKLSDLNAAVVVTDICDPNPTFVLTSITSNEPENGTGDGDTAPDIVGADYGTADVMFQLRSERAGNGSGRRYTITYTASDESGNQAVAVVYVDVPQHLSAGALCSVGLSADGTALEPGASWFALVVPSTDMSTTMGIEGGSEDLLITPDGSLAKPQPLYGGDVDPWLTMVGNSYGAIRPFLMRIKDVDHDGVSDAVLYFRTADASRVLSGSASDDGPMGLHFQVLGGRNFLVNDIFALGAPVSLPAVLERVPVDRDPGIHGAGDGGEPTAAVESQAAPAPEALPEMQQALPRLTRFTGVYPNPFAASATVAFDLATDDQVLVAVYDLRGALVQTLRSAWLPAGRYQVAWDGRDRAGHIVPGGVYLIRLNAAGKVTTRKAVLMK